MIKYHIQERVIINLLRQIIKAYKFTNKNQIPDTIVFPPVHEVDGVKIEYPGQEKVGAIEEVANGGE